jgi:FkbM family methyltransferase
MRLSEILRRFKHRVRRRRLERHGVCVELSCPTETLGEDWGSWVICPEGLGPQSVFYSFGVGTDITFDLALLGRFGAPVHAFDPTPVSVEWVRAQRLPELFRFHDVGIADFDGTMPFHLPRRTGSAHFSPVARRRGADASPPVHAPVLRLRSIMARFGHRRIDLMKMDIEGGEYAVIEDVLRERLPVRQLLIEFHHNYATIPLRRTVDAIGRLHESGYRLFHISERTYEMSFLRNSPFSG